MMSVSRRVVVGRLTGKFEERLLLSERKVERSGIGNGRGFKYFLAEGAESVSCEVSWELRLKNCWLPRQNSADNRWY